MDTERGKRQGLSQTRSKKETENVDKSGHVYFAARYHFIAGFETGYRSKKSSHVTLDFAAKMSPNRAFRGTIKADQKVTAKFVEGGAVGRRSDEIGMCGTKNLVASR
jgi:hypothetical protein